MDTSFLGLLDAEQLHRALTLYNVNKSAEEIRTLVGEISDAEGGRISYRMFLSAMKAFAEF